MADQTVSLKLEGDASDLKGELQQSAEAMDDLAGASTSAAADIEQSVTGASSAWEEHSGVINGVAAAVGVAGAAMEGWARSQQDATVDLARTATATGLQSDALRELAADTANVTFATEDVIGTFHALGRQGIDTEEDLQRVANVWDLVADATGENVVQLAEGSVALRTLGIDAREPEQALDALGFITSQTTGSVGEFLTFVERTGPQLRDLGMDVNDAAAMLAILEQEFGMTGRVARSEFRAAVNEANGDLGVMLDVLGVAPDSFDAMRSSVEGSSEALDANAQALDDSFTPMQRLSAWVDEVSLRYGGLSDAASMLSPVLIGAGGMVFAINQVVSAKQTWGATAGRLAGTLGRGAGVAGVATAAAFGIERLGRALTESLHGGAQAVDDLTLAFEGLAATGEIPDVVAGSLDNLETHLERVLDPRFTDDWWGPLSSPRADVATESIENLDQALADAARSGNDAALAAGMDTLETMADNLGIPLDDLIARAFPEYGRAAAAAGLASDEAGDDVDGLGDDFNDLRDDVEDARQAHQDYIDDLRAATDPVFAMNRALGGVEAAQDAYNDAVREHGPASDEARAASLDLASAITDAELAAIDGDLSFDDFSERLRGWVRQGHITAEQADVMRDRVAELRGEAESFAGEYDAHMATHGIETGIELLDSFTIAADRAARERTLRLNTTVVGPEALDSWARQLPARADGGPVSPDLGPVLVGERGPELVTFGERGYVHDAATTAQAFASPVYAGPAAVGGGGTAVSIPVSIDIDGVAREVGRADAFVDSYGRVTTKQARLTGQS